MTKAFEHIFFRERVKAAYIQGSAFHRYGRDEMKKHVREAKKEGKILSHYSPEANYLNKLESLFFQYAATGTGMYRYYLHTDKIAAEWGQKAGTLTPWSEMDPDTDLLLYRGLHGAAIDGDIDIASYPDLLVGMVPNVNLEWIRKIKRDTTMRGYSRKKVRKIILQRMADYAMHIAPQFTRTHINMQMIATVDTSDPFSVRDEPTEDETMLVIHFQNIQQPDLPELLRELPGSFMSRHNTLVVPGGQMMYAIELVLMPLIHDLIATSRKIRNITDVPADRGAGLLGALGQSYLKFKYHTG
jgi:phosphoribulokinase